MSEISEIDPVSPLMRSFVFIEKLSFLFLFWRSCKRVQYNHIIRVPVYLFQTSANKLLLSDKKRKKKETFVEMWQFVRSQKALVGFAIKRE